MVACARTNWKRMASLAVFILLFYLFICGLHHLNMQSEMKCRRCFISKTYTWRW